MIFRRLLVLLLLLTLPVQAAPEAADLVLRNGAVYTLDAARSWADAVAIREGRISYVGAEKGVEPYIGPATKVVDLKGRMVLPGFHDSHVHPVQGGIELGRCDLNNCSTPAEVYATIRKYAAAHPDAAWIIGSGWALPLFPQANPKAADLDRIVRDRPAFIEAADGHSAWVNTKALRVAGITRATKDPPDGRIERDARGNPTGTLRESAIELVSAHVPKATPEEVTAGLRRGLDVAKKFGITSLQDANADERALEAYMAADRDGTLTARVVASQCVDTEGDEAQVAAMVARRELFRGRLFRTTTAKIFADGVIEARTAALLKPYVKSKSTGFLNMPPDKFARMVTALDAAGFQVHVHAIGDRAVRTALDSFEAAQRANGRRDARHHIAHLQLIDPSDIPRFRRLNVIANFQPYWFQADDYVTELTDPVLGPRRARLQYPAASMVRSGAVVAAGSDWTVSTMNPLEAIQVALTRKDVSNPPGPGWLPEQKVTLPTMLAAYTIEGAYLNDQEKITGSLEVGKSADLIVLDRNLFDIPVSDIHRVKVVLTLLEGRTVYSR
ncbi:MAG: amidohydrolase [Armatimonadetes bacterium]|nr:amidohydrolase [Armatimonadota bacterium]